MPDTDRSNPESYQARELTYRVVAMPADTNAYGDIFGGWLMSQVDIAGSIIGVRDAAGRIATVAVKEFRFHAPVLVGDLVSCYARPHQIGRTSITVDVQVYVSRSRSGKVTILRVAESMITYVALDNNGRPREIAARQPKEQ